MSVLIIFGGILAALFIFHDSGDRGMAKGAFCGFAGAMSIFSTDIFPSQIEGHAIPNYVCKILAFVLFFYVGLLLWKLLDKLKGRHADDIS